MRKPNVSVPSYRYHKPSGQGVVTLSGKDFYLDPWQSESSVTEYRRLLAEWMDLYAIDSQNRTSRD